MNIQDEKQAVKSLIAVYSNALNSSDTKLLHTLYSEGGVFMPSGFHTLSGKEEIQRSSKRFFKQRRISIAFEVKDIVIEGDFAFVHANSKCKVYLLSSGEEGTSTGKDFFVLRKEKHQWKVYRYMFNS